MLLSSINSIIDNDNMVIWDYNPVTGHRIEITNDNIANINSILNIEHLDEVILSSSLTDEQTIYVIEMIAKKTNFYLDKLICDKPEQTRDFRTMDPNILAEAFYKVANWQLPYGSSREMTAEQIAKIDWGKVYR